MAAGVITVRSLETPQELEWLCGLAAVTFGAGEDSAEAGRRWRRRTTENPRYRAGQWRGAFREGGLAGGYIMHEREMRVGAARVRTACIGAVVTHPDHRRAGVGRALMLDAIRHARERKHALLLLDGIPDFYHRFGYVDVFDLTEHHLARQAIAVLGPSPYRVRPVQETDAAAVLPLYDRQYGRYTGSFERDLPVQRHELCDDFGPHPMVLALDERDTPRGYLEVRRSDPVRANEVTAEDWPAILALLSEHARIIDDHGEPGASLRWALPSDSPILAELIDRLVLPDTSCREHITTLCSVESRTYHHPNAGWLARPADVGMLLDSLLPAWCERWEASSRPWRGALTLEVEAECRTLVLGEGLELRDVPGSPAVTLTAGALIQMVFGYRDVGYLAGRDGNRIPEEVAPVLRILFPTGTGWIPGTDAF